MDHYKTLHPAKYFEDCLEENIRSDGRILNEFRPIIFDIGSIKIAHGSAFVSNGCSAVCGIRAELGPTKMDEPDRGYLVINTELSPLCSSEFPSGPPGKRAQALTARVNEMIKDCPIVDTKSLCICENNLAWTLYCDIVCLSYDGSAQDIFSMGLLAALRNVKLPKAHFDEDTKSIRVDESVQLPLKLLNAPLSVSFALFNDKLLLCDPCSEEENFCKGSLTVVIDGENVLSITKTGYNHSVDQLLDCIEKAKARYAAVINLMTSAEKSKLDGE